MFRYTSKLARALQRGEEINSCTLKLFPEFIINHNMEDLHVQNSTMYYML